MFIDITQLKQQKQHFPVLIREVLEYLNLSDNAVYVDATFGEGGYSRAILEHSNAKVIALDRDATVTPYAELLTKEYTERFTFCLTKFSKLKAILTKLEHTKVDGIVLDLGLSTMQLKDKSRGFSFNVTDDNQSFLLMQMGINEVSAAEFLNSASEQTLRDVIFYYGEERLAKQVAKAVIIARKQKKITMTAEIIAVLRKVLGYKRKNKIDPLTKTFQALRIHVNQELTELREILKIVPQVLKPKGRVIVVSFHSLEDRIVKNFLSNDNLFENTTMENSAKGNQFFKVINKKVIIPQTDELRINAPSRSAKMRVGELL